MFKSGTRLVGYQVDIFEWLMVFTAQIGYFYTFNYDMEDELG